MQVFYSDGLLIDKLKIGSSSSYLSIANDGSMTLSGSARTYSERYYGISEMQSLAYPSHLAYVQDTSYLGYRMSATGTTGTIGLSGTDQTIYLTATKSETYPLTATDVTIGVLITFDISTTGSTTGNTVRFNYSYSNSSLASGSLGTLSTLTASDVFPEFSSLNKISVYNTIPSMTYPTQTIAIKIERDTTWHSGDYNGDVFVIGAFIQYDTQNIIPLSS